MWIQDEESTVADSDEESCLSSEDWADIQCEILEKQRDEANQRLTELEEVSNNLLKEIDMLEIQFQVERSCRESAEALALKVSKENKALKRKSQMLTPLISNLPENLVTATFDPETVVDGDVVDFGECNSEENLLLESQAKITALQASLDGLLAEKLRLELQVEELTREQVHLREQVAVEAEEKEAILRKMTKQTKTMSKIKRVSQLVTEEFTEMSQKLEIEQGLRQHAEVFAHKMLVEQKAVQGPSTMEMCSSEADRQLQLQEALNQIHHISKALCSIQHYYQDQVKQSSGAEEDDSELRYLKEQLKKSEEEKRTLESQLSQANASVTELKEEVKQLQQTMSTEEKNEELEKVTAPAPPPPPPPPPPPSLPNPAFNLQDFLRSRKQGVSAVDDSKPAPLMDIKAKAVDEMMDRIKKGIILRPIQKIQDEDSSWRDQRSENRKSAVLELKGMLDNIKRQHFHRVPSRRVIGRNVGEAELQLVLQRRRRAMGENQDRLPSAQTYGTISNQDCSLSQQQVTVPGLVRSAVHLCSGG